MDLEPTIRNQQQQQQQRPTNNYNRQQTSTPRFNNNNNNNKQSRFQPATTPTQTPNNNNNINNNQTQQQQLDYLFEELRIIKNLPKACLSVDIFDEMLCVFIKINAILNNNLVFTEITNKNKRLRDDEYLSSVYKLYAIRLYIELSQFVNLKHLCTQNEYFKTSICNQMTVDECLVKANKLLDSYECPSSKSHSLKKCQCIQYQIVKFLACLSTSFHKFASYCRIFNESLKQSSKDNLLCSEIHYNTDESLDNLSDLLINLENQSR